MQVLTVRITTDAKIKIVKSDIKRSKLFYWVNESYKIKVADILNDLRL